MLRLNQLIPACAIATIIVLAVLSLSCGSSSSNHTLSAAQAQAVSQELFTALGNAMASGFQTPVAHDETPRLPSIIGNIHGSQPAGCTIFSLDNSGDGSDSTSLTVTPTNCAVSNTTFNGDPSITVATQFSFQNNLPLYPLTFTETGGISFGPNPSGSCTLNVSVSVTSATACTVTGNICGQSVNGNC